MTTTENSVGRSAAISPCGDFRWWLRRDWGEGPMVTWVMLNPARADAERDDPTIRRVMTFSATWGFGSATIVNLYPFRSTIPAECRVWAATDPSAGRRIRQNDRAIAQVLRSAVSVVAAWGTVPWARDRAEWIAAKLSRPGMPDVQCLGMNADGSPIHPLARGRNRIPDCRRAVPWIPVSETY